MFLVIFRIAVAIFALLLIALGILLTPSPIPFGIIIIAIGVALLVTAAPGFVRWLRNHWKWLDRQMHRLEGVLPEFMAKHLRRTDVNHDTDDQTDDANEEDGEFA